MTEENNPTPENTPKAETPGSESPAVKETTAEVVAEKTSKKEVSGACKKN